MWSTYACVMSLQNGDYYCVMKDMKGISMDSHDNITLKNYIESERTMVKDK